MIDIPAGHLFLGEHLDPETRKRNGEPVLLEAADLTTHGVIVGMTGSGKTGLGVVLIEEALLAGVPTLIIDPKGDLGNLLLAFPELKPDDFAPWVEGGDPADVAKQWSEGLADWGIEPSRIAQLREAAEFTIYTPGSTSGVPLDIVGGLDRPADGADPETVADEVEGYVSGLLTMVGIEADPLASKEHILLSNLVHNAWSSGHDIDLASLVGQVQDPPLRKLGVYELDTFYPAKDRSKLAVTLNGLLASHSFAAWAEGPDIDLDRLLQSADGERPGCAIVSLSHLSDQERQFVVSLLLGKLVTWMRRQPGTDQLRVLVYFDEVMGFVPPTAMPAAKKPILTLFKTARAFGVGIVLATQNPVDVDYKGLSNAGTWMIGRLQTEQDKARLLDGLSSAGGSVDIHDVGDVIGGLDKREFMMREPGREAPALFTTRWAMSYLRGPLTREQISTIMHGRYPPSATGGSTPTAATAEPAATPEPAATTVPVVPPVPEDVPVRWLAPAAPWAARVGAIPNGTKLAPSLVTRVSLLYDDDKLDLRETEEWEAVLFPLGATVDPSASIAVDHDDRDLRTEAPPGASYVLTDAPLNKKTFFTGAEKALVDHLYRNRTMRVMRNPELKLIARVGETPEQFAARCSAAAAEGADQHQVALQKKYESRITKARESLGAAMDRVAQAQAAENTRRQSDMVAGAGSLLGAVLGGRRSARAMARDMSRVLAGQGRREEAAQRVRSAENRAVDRQQALTKLEADLARDLTAIDEEWAAKAAAIEPIEVPLERSDIRVTARSLVWIPVG
ncbi:MAG TPA: helicase HerA-like domain-containing protein [Acidimicrobiales bacterium]|nr:helicase HerA-like domain-containing protein [Acidimicrobiales bacterium]